MFANTFQSGFISVFYSVGSNPLQLWDKQVKNGHIRRVVDDEVRSLVLEISGTNVATTYITCPIKPRVSLGIKLPFLVMILKNMKKYFTFEIQILDDKDMHRRFRVSNFQSTTKVRPFCTTMPIGLSSGWNQIQFNLADFTKRAYGSTYLETTRVQIHANVRIRRIYFADMLYSDEDLPNEYKLFLPTPGAPRSKGIPPKKPDAKAAAAAEKAAAEQPPPEVQKLISMEKLDDVQNIEEEIPSGAPPTPAGPYPDETPVMVQEQPTIVEEVSAEASPGDETPASEMPETPASEVAETPTEEVSEQASAAPGEEVHGGEGAEPVSEGGAPASEGAEVVEAEVEASAAESEAKSEVAPSEGVSDAPGEGDVAPPAESEAASEQAGEAEQAPAEEAAEAVAE